MNLDETLCKRLNIMHHVRIKMMNLPFFIFKIYSFLQLFACHRHLQLFSYVKRWVFLSTFASVVSLTFTIKWKFLEFYRQAETIFNSQKRQREIIIPYSENAQCRQCIFHGVHFYSWDTVHVECLKMGLEKCEFQGHTWGRRNSISSRHFSIKR